MFQFELANETHARRERMRDEQNEAMEVQTGVRELLVVEMEIHVAGQIRPRRFAACRCRLRRLRERG